MAPLDDDKVRTYAAAKNAPELDSLIDAIQAANMWDFARRPLDLDWIVRYWRDHGRLGSLTAMIEASLRERVREVDPDRARRDSLDAERAQRGLERIGAALVFGRQTTIAIPDKDAPIEAARPAVTIDEVLPDWSSEDRLQLLTRPAFDPATFGRARLHNDNEGVVRALSCCTLAAPTATSESAAAPPARFLVFANLRGRADQALHARNSGLVEPLG